MVRKLLGVALGLGFSLTLAGSPAWATPSFTDWTSIDSTAETASGVVLGASVLLSGGEIDGGVTSGSFTGFDNVLFTPPLTTSDVVQILGESESDGTGFAYTVTFGSTVVDPVLHLLSLASTLTFDSGPVITRLSGDPGLTVAGNVVSGTTLDGTTPNDANGSVRLEGSFQSFSFTAVWNTCAGGPCGAGKVDGIQLQVGSNRCPSRAPGCWCSWASAGSHWLGAPHATRQPDPARAPAS